MTWQPIETAPRDGSEVLLFCPDLNRDICIGHFIDSEDIQYGKSVRKRQAWYLGSFLPFGSDPKPTHWMALPEAPRDV